MDFIKNLQLAAATSIADVSLLGGFMVVEMGKRWLEMNVPPSIPGGYWPQTLAGSAIGAAADISKFVIYDLSTHHQVGAMAAVAASGGT